MARSWRDTRVACRAVVAVGADAGVVAKCNRRRVVVNINQVWIERTGNKAIPVMAIGVWVWHAGTAERGIASEVDQHGFRLGGSRESRPEDRDDREARGSLRTKNHIHESLQVV